MGAHMLMGLGAGMMMAWRVNVAMNSAEKDRAKANSLTGFCFYIGFILGPSERGGNKNINKLSMTEPILMNLISNINFIQIDSKFKKLCLKKGNENFVNCIKDCGPKIFLNFFPKLIYGDYRDRRTRIRRPFSHISLSC